MQSEGLNRSRRVSGTRVWLPRYASVAAQVELAFCGHSREMLKLPEFHDYQPGQLPVRLQFVYNDAVHNNTHINAQVAEGKAGVQGGAPSA